jgi:hypothetical protein
MHPKMLAVSVPARWLFMEMLCYCSEYMTDGVVPEVVAKRLATNTASDTLSGLHSLMLSKELSKKTSKMLSSSLGVGLQELAEHLINELKSNGDPATLSYENGAFLIHDYLGHQASRKDILARQERLREAGRRGGLAKGKQNAKQDPSKMLSKGSSENVADKDKDIDIDISKEKIYKKETEPLPAKTRKRAVPLPADWKPNPTHARIALERGIDLEAQAEKFRDYARAHGKAYRDWDAGFRNWLRSPYVKPENSSTHYVSQGERVERMFKAAANRQATQQQTQTQEDQQESVFGFLTSTGGDAA